MRLCKSDVSDEIRNADLFKLKQFTQNDLSYALSRFIREVKKLDDTDYPPNTLHDIIIMIQMYLLENGVYWKLFDLPEFVELRNVVDNTMHERTAAGLGVKQSSNIILMNYEEKLFASCQLGDGNLQQLLNTIVYVVGLHSALRGAREHYCLRCPGFNS